MSINLWIPADTWKIAKKQKPQDVLEVLGITDDGNFDIVLYDYREHQWIEANSMTEVKVKYWIELPKSPKPIKPIKPIKKLDGIHPAVLASILPND